ncbi:MAG: DUF3298 and DUF4163 domain-containing protein [Fervidobacterium sp.]|uniref:DUF3298 and DUF4163 domain-containing protein n=1 Tax=Fervidobacterium sp. TaxID=1871331 RepID=UPI004049BCD3
MEEQKRLTKQLSALSVLFLIALIAYMLSLNTKQVVLVETKTEDKLTKIFVQIPKFQNFKNENIQNELNNEIQEKVKKLVEEVKEIAEEVNKVEGLRYPYEAHISTEITYESRDIISLVIYYYTFTGGAHGNTVFETYNIDAKTGKILTLADLFDGTCDYTKVIKDEIIKQIKAEEQNYFPESIEYVIQEDFSNKTFTISKDGLQIRYQDYEIAPHSTGLPTFTIPWDKFEKCLKYVIK